MGKIIETNYHETVGKITSFATDLVNNPFYVLNDKKPSIVTYYNINKEKSSLDPGSKLSYDNIGSESPIRFNKISDFILYGFNRIELNTENDEFGLEAEKISGDCYILPNTITPTEGDYFEVEHITDSTWLFIVTDVQQDTLKNGSNVYKIQYKLEYVDHDRLQQQIVDNFKMIEKREGTNIVKIVEETKFEKAKKIDEVAVMLKTYFNNLFYNNKVQTFIYTDLTEWRIYDPYMIEFLIRNKILDNGNDSFIYVCHQLDTVATFSMDYDRTFYRAIELCSKDRFSTAERTIQLEDIVSYGTTFAGRFETYYKARYIKPLAGYSGTCIDDELYYAIMDNTIVEDFKDLEVKPPLWRNIIVKYFNGGEITEKEVQSVVDMHFDKSITAFYIIPVLIFCLENTIEKLLK